MMNMNSEYYTFKRNITLKHVNDQLGENQLKFNNVTQMCNALQINAKQVEQIYEQITVWLTTNESFLTEIKWVSENKALQSCIKFLNNKWSDQFEDLETVHIHQTCKKLIQQVLFNIRRNAVNERRKTQKLSLQTATSLTSTTSMNLVSKDENFTDASNTCSSLARSVSSTQHILNRRESNMRVFQLAATRIDTSAISYCSVYQMMSKTDSSNSNFIMQISLNEWKKLLKLNLKLEEHAFTIKYTFEVKKMISDDRWFQQTMYASWQNDQRHVAFKMKLIVLTSDMYCQSYRNHQDIIWY